MLKHQTEDSTEMMLKQKAYITLQNTKFNGKGWFTFNQFFLHFQNTYNKLEMLSKPILEMKKVQDLIQGISNSSFQLTKTFILGNANLQQNFDTTHQDIKTLITLLAFDTARR